MRIVTTLPQDKLGKVDAAVRAIEATGYDGVFTLENRHDPFLPLAIAATQTTRIELATGIAIAFSRSPMTVANIAWDLQQASGGRFVLGLGSQIRAHNERRFSVPWSAPAPRLREYVAALRCIWRCWKYGEKLDYRGAHYQFTLMTPNFVPEGGNLPLPAITLAAVGTKMLTVSAEVADGVRLHPFCTRRYLEDIVMPRIERGLAKRGLSRAHFDISGGGFIATAADEDGLIKQREWIRYRIGFYASTPAYWPILEHEGYAALGPQLNALTKQGQWHKLAAAVPDELLYACAVIARHDELRARIEARFADLVDTVNASVSSELPADIPPDLIRSIQQIPCRWRAYETA